MMKAFLFSVGKSDLRIDFFSGSGSGGQNRNKNQNCVRIHHDDSGVIVTGQSQRDRKSNMREGLINLSKHPKFKVWQAKRCWEINNHKTLDQVVDELMKEENLKVEYYDPEKEIK